MKENKNIDRLFQEKFKDFEAQPDPKVWKAILAAKDEKKSKKIIPLWIRWGGVAAILAGLLIGGNIWFERSEAPLVQNETPLTDESPKDNLDPGDLKTRDTLVRKNAIAGGKAVNAAVQYAGFPEENSARRSQGQTKDTSAEGHGQDQNNTPSHSQGNVLLAKAKEQAAGSAVINLSNTTEGLAVTTQTSQEKTFIGSIVSLNDAIAVLGKLPNRDSASRDSASVEANPLEELLRANPVVDRTERDKNAGNNKRWVLTPNVGPVYYDSFEGSGIDPRFASNPKQGNVNMSYGLQLSYEVSDRFKLRSGVSRLDLSYSTNNIALVSEMGLQPISALNYNANAELMQLAISPVRSNAGQTDATAEFKSLPKMQEGRLRQSLNYIEVPVELEYVLINRRFGVNLIGGASTLFLTNNAISIESGRDQVSIGDSNSLNNTSFSTNIGLGLNYEMSNTIHLNLEPMFKYQINAYSNTVSDFRPYYMGLYTGIKIAF